MVFFLLSTFVMLRNTDRIKAFGEHLRKLRNMKNMSQQELADIADVNKKTIQRIEHAKISPSLDTLISIAKGLNVDISELFNY